MRIILESGPVGKLPLVQEACRVTLLILVTDLAYQRHDISPCKCFFDGFNISPPSIFLHILFCFEPIWIISCIIFCKCPEFVIMTLQGAKHGFMGCSGPWQLDLFCFFLSLI